MNMVDAVARDPLSPINFDHSSGSGEYETKLLESTIEKITGLLRVGFGEAGAGIIKANLSVNEGSNSSAINPLLPGIRVYAIVGFCDIHHFEDVNLRLTKEVLTFVNTIAAIVHESVHHWSGQCNKNLGNAFVIIWRIGDENTLLQQTSASKSPARQTILRMDTSKSVAATTAGSMGDDDEPKRKAVNIDLRRVPGVDTLADHALIGYLKIIAEINRDPNVMAYRHHPKLTTEGEFKVRMGFGLHAGWAIEGAVGSLQKVDATYLSPHVNMAARLETSSRQYGVPLLASQNFFDLMSPEGQDSCRRLDVITVKGSEVPIGIFTYDALQDQVFNDNKIADNHRHRASTVVAPGQLASLQDSSVMESAALAPSVLSQQSFQQSFKSSKAPKFMTKADPTDEIFDMDSDLLQLRAHVTDKFLHTFNEGVKAYLAGDWPAARTFLEDSDKQMAEAAPSLGGDGPSQTLLSYMSDHGWTAPSTWKGFRPLTSK